MKSRLLLVVPVISALLFAILLAGLIIYKNGELMSFFRAPTKDGGDSLVIFLALLVYLLFSLVAHVFSLIYVATEKNRSLGH